MSILSHISVGASPAKLPDMLQLYDTFTVKLGAPLIKIVFT
jgi:hypothetical protein